MLLYIQKGKDQIWNAVNLCFNIRQYFESTLLHYFIVSRWGKMDFGKTPIKVRLKKKIFFRVLSHSVVKHDVQTCPESLICLMWSNRKIPVSNILYPLSIYQQAPHYPEIHTLFLFLLSLLDSRQHLQPGVFSHLCDKVWFCVIFPDRLINHKRLCLTDEVNSPAAAAVTWRGELSSTFPFPCFTIWLIGAP